MAFPFLVGEDQMICIYKLAIEDFFFLSLIRPVTNARSKAILPERERERERKKNAGTGISFAATPCYAEVNRGNRNKLRHSSLSLSLSRAFLPVTTRQYFS